MSTRIKLNLSAASLALVIVVSLLVQVSVGFAEVANYIKYNFYDKDNLILNLSLVNPAVKSVAADPSNKVVLRIEVRDRKGNPVPMAPVTLSLDGNTKAHDYLGDLTPQLLRTDDYGELLVVYSPPEASKEFLTQKETNIKITAAVKNTGIKSQQSIKLVRNPVVFIHGYQAYAYIFENFGEYLKSKGFQTSAIEYKSVNGIIVASNILKDFLLKQKMQYLAKGLQVQRFDLVAHSMGGLVARYYTCSEDFIRDNNVRKIIFISVPQKGSPLASLGASFFDDKGVSDLIPENPLLSKALPQMLNKGLNNTIQVGSILGQYDEVVSPESASLEEWSLNTELFSIGESNLNFDNILKGNFSEATNHMNILSNRKVFERVESMLYEKLPYPSLKK
ncbi:MAG: alpha/beta hydrolase [Clostridia bacterium]|nr:alpha/beta hydrolase [Clostridia bacterium]